MNDIAIAPAEEDGSTVATVENYCCIALGTCYRSNQLYEDNTHVGVRLQVKGLQQHAVIRQATKLASRSIRTWLAVQLRGCHGVSGAGGSKQGP